MSTIRVIIDYRLFMSMILYSYMGYRGVHNQGIDGHRHVTSMIPYSCRGYRGGGGGSTSKGIIDHRYFLSMGCP